MNRKEYTFLLTDVMLTYTHQLTRHHWMSPVSPFPCPSKLLLKPHRRVSRLNPQARHIADIVAAPATTFHSCFRHHIQVLKCNLSPNTYRPPIYGAPLTQQNEQFSKTNKAMTYHQLYETEHTWSQVEGTS